LTIIEKSDIVKTEEIMNRRINIKAILKNRVLRRKLMVPVIQAIQAREGIETTQEQAEQAYDAVQKRKGF